MDSAVVFIIFVLQACIFGGFCSYIAGQKGRGRGNWFILGFCFSFLAVLALIAIPRLNQYMTRNPPIPDSGPGLAAPIATTVVNPAERQCPFCAETVKAAAKICRFCQRDLPPLEVAQADEAFSGLNGERLGVINCKDKDEAFCIEVLKASGHTVSFSSPNKWTISTGPGKSISYAYSLADLRRIASRPH